MKTALITIVATLVLAVNLQARDRYTVDDLTKASAEGNLTRVIAILDSGVDINAKDSKGWYAISKAAVHGQENTLYLLTSRRANIDAMTSRRPPPHLCYISWPRRVSSFSPECRRQFIHRQCRP